MKAFRFLSLLLALLLLCVSPSVRAEAPSGNGWGLLLADLVRAYETPSEGDRERLRAEAEALDDEVARSVVSHWEKVYLDPDYHLNLWGQDDPRLLSLSGRHAIVVLGYELNNGRMQGELMGRCQAAAAVARAFPESILVCSGGATGGNNPEKHTEAGLMKEYLSEKCGIDPERIFIDEQAMTTAENALHTLAILRQQGTETMTLVTSSYHQRWGQVLYNAVAARYRRDYGYSVEIVENYCYDVRPSSNSFRQDDRIAIHQLAGILELSPEERRIMSDAMPSP